MSCKFCHFEFPICGNNTFKTCRFVKEANQKFDKCHKRAQVYTIITEALAHNFFVSRNSVGKYRIACVKKVIDFEDLNQRLTLKYHFKRV